MSNSGDFFQIPATCQSSTRPPEDDNYLRRADPLLNLSAARARMDSLHQFLSHSVNNNTLIGKHHMEMVSTEISSAIHQIIVNGAALLSSSQLPPYPDQTSQNPNLTVNPSLMPKSAYLTAPENVGDFNMQNSIDPVDLTSSSQVTGVVEMKVEVEETNDEISSEDWEIVELDAVELLAEHVHFCEICGKGFKRDANLRMHMRAHGNQFKTPEALAKPAKSPAEPNRRNTRFSCPYAGCNRNRNHKKFRPLKSVICVKNHFKRSHCPKMYSCTRCNKKSFSVVADLKSHLKHCGVSKWKCSCGTTFSRKDKLFSHMALFEGHMPAVMEEEEKKKEAASVEVIEVDEEVEDLMKGAETGDNSADDGFFDGLLDGFDAIDGYSLQDVLGMGSPSGLGTSMNDFYNF